MKTRKLSLQICEKEQMLWATKYAK